MRGPDWDGRRWVVTRDLYELQKQIAVALNALAVTLRREIGPVLKASVAVIGAGR